MKVFLVNVHEDGFDSVSRVFAKAEDAEAVAEMLRLENESEDGQADYDVYVIEMEVE